MNIFISYSHKDEAFREELVEHISMLQRRGFIDIWHDRKITTSEDWRNEISENLEKADITIFLVSSSFLASPYCQDIEVKKAIELHESRKTKIVSIVIRSCDWHESEFGRYQALPQDAKPIALWDDKDSAWTNAVNGIKELITELKKEKEKEKEKEKHPKTTTDPSTTISRETSEWLDETEILLTHRKTNKVKLGEIYVIPDLENLKESKKKEIEIISSEKLTQNDSYSLISGEEQQGKTSLLKYIFKTLATTGIAPIYIDAKEVKTADIEKIIQENTPKQYNFENSPPEIECLLIDNLDEIGLNNRFRGKFLEQARARFPYIVATCHSSFKYVFPEIPELSGYDHYSLMGLGHLKRSEMVERWISLGQEESIEDDELYTKCDELRARLDSVIRKNIVPPKPIYVLMLVQMFEAYAQQNFDLTSYGHCYQQLIYQSLDNAQIPKHEYEKYINVLTELAWYIHRKGDDLTQVELEGFFAEYEQSYLAVRRKEIVSKLIGNSILCEKNQKIKFKYPYIFYFFAAKKIAESYSSNLETKTRLRDLLENLHREDYANILIFVTHHTKEKWMLEEFESILTNLFSENQKAELTKEQLSFMDSFIAQIPELIIERREIKQERESHLRRLDKLESFDQENELDPGTSANDLLALINKTFKGMEISGQIIRNRHATLTKQNLSSLASQGASAGLRFLDYFLEMSSNSRIEIIKFIESRLQEQPHLTDRDIQADAQTAYLQITYGVINGVIRKIASSIGSKEAFEIYKSLEQQEKTPAFALLNQAIELQFNRKLDISSIEQTAAKIKNNPVCMRILKEMTIQHTYMFPVSYKEKQQLSSLLKIPVQMQNQLDIRKRGKG